jgi:hypothetical protein
MNLGDGTWNVGKGCKEPEPCHKKKTLSELAHFDSPFVFRLKLGFVSGALGA